MKENILPAQTPNFLPWWVFWLHPAVGGREIQDCGRLTLRRHGGVVRVWHNHYPMDEQLQTVRAEARSVQAILGAPVIPLLCVHGASVQWGGLAAQGVAIVPAGQLGAALGADAVLSAEQVAVLAGTAQTRLHPAH